MIHKLSKQDLKTFAEQPSGVAVSLCMPTVQAGAETKQNPIRYKNLVREAEARLTALEGESKEDLLEYFRQIDRGLHALLRDEQAPLVLAGVEYLQPIDREANTYAHLIEAGVTGNSDHVEMDALREQAWPLVEPIFLQAEAEAAAQYERYAGTEQASDDLSAIVPAAFFGRVEALFVALGVQQWGHFDRKTAVVTLDNEEGEAGEDLLNLAALHTFLNGGVVYAVEADAVPSHQSAAAVYRY